MFGCVYVSVCLIEFISVDLWAVRWLGAGASVIVSFCGLSREWVVVCLRVCMFVLDGCVETCG